MRASLTALAIAVALAGLPGRALATTLFERPAASPFDAGTLFSDLQRPREAASPFTLDGDAQLSTVVWWGGFEVPPSVVPNQFEIRIFADTGSGPAVVPLLIAAVTAATSLFPSPLTEFEFSATLPAPVLLAAGVSYWISILDVDPANATFAWRKSSEGSYSFSRLPEETWSKTDGLGSVRLEGVLVPEPGTAVLAALGLAGLCAARARRPRGA